MFYLSNDRKAVAFALLHPVCEFAELLVYPPMPCCTSSERQAGHTYGHTVNQVCILLTKPGPPMQRNAGHTYLIHRSDVHIRDIITRHVDDKTGQTHTEMTVYCFTYLYLHMSGSTSPCIWYHSKLLSCVGKKHFLRRTVC